MARGSGSFSDAVRTTAVMGALLVGMFVVGKVVTVDPERPSATVDLGDAVTGAKAVVAFNVHAPSALPAGWIATSARFEPQAWHLGVLTGDDKYIGLEQAAVLPKTLIEDFAPKSKPAGQVKLAGRVWKVRTEHDGDRIYVRSFAKSAVLVIGSAPRADLERYVSSLS